eukprot:11209702-Lingulodinium_polyedra.AAC.1
MDAEARGLQQDSMLPRGSRAGAHATAPLPMLVVGVQRETRAAHGPRVLLYRPGPIERPP